MQASVQAPVAAGAAPHKVLRYRLSPADALAWERRDPVARKRDRVAIGGGLFAGIGLLSVTSRHLPAWLSSLHSNALALVILCLPLGLVLLFQRFDLGKRALRRVGGDTDVTLELWDRRISERRADGAAPLVLGAQSVRGVIETAGHVFVTSRSGTVIVPATAFADSAAKAEFAAHWARLSG